MVHPMQPQPDRSRRPSPAILASLIASALLVGSGVAYWTWQSARPAGDPPLSAVPNTASSPASPSVPAANEQSVQLYWLKTENNQIQLAPSAVAVQVDPVQTEAQPAATLKAAIETLLQGSGDPTLTSTIPEGTRLLGLEIKPDGVHVDLSAEFTSGGGSASMTGRLGQILYTATTLNPDAPVWLAVDGEPLETLGGEGLLLEQPMTRSDFQQNFQL